MTSIFRPRSLLILPALALLGMGGLTNDAHAQCNLSQSMNWTQQLRGTYSNGISNVAIQANSGTQLQRICRIDLFMRARFQSQTLNIRIWLTNGPWANGTLLGSSTMSVPMTAQTCTAWFTPSVIVPPNSVFWIEYDQATTVIWPVVTTGSVVPHYRLLNSVWAQVSSLPWCYKIYSGKATKAAFVTFGTGCPTSSPPVLKSSDRPVLNQAFTINLNNARPNSPAIFILGFSKQSINLPPAPGCSLLTIPTLLLGAVTDKNGELPIIFPASQFTNPKLDGLKFYSQFFVYDKSANKLGLVASNGGDATIGTY